MKTNQIMDAIRNTTPTETNKQVDFCVAIANRIFDVMAKQGMEQRDLAKALGVTETEVSRWLSGTHNLTIATIAKIAAVLGDDIITTTYQSRQAYDFYFHSLDISPIPLFKISRNLLILSSLSEKPFRFQMQF